MQFLNSFTVSSGRAEPDGKLSGRSVGASIWVWVSGWMRRWRWYCCRSKFHFRHFVGVASAKGCGSIKPTIILALTKLAETSPGQQRKTQKQATKTEFVEPWTNPLTTNHDREGPLCPILQNGVDPERDRLCLLGSYRSGKKVETTRMGWLFGPRSLLPHTQTTRQGHKGVGPRYKQTLQAQPRGN